MLLFTNSKGHKSNSPTQDSPTTFKPNLTCIFLSTRARYIISNPSGGPCRTTLMDSAVFNFQFLGVGGLKVLKKLPLLQWGSKFCLILSRCFWMLAMLASYSYTCHLLVSFEAVFDQFSGKKMKFDIFLKIHLMAKIEVCDFFENSST